MNLNIGIVEDEKNIREGIALLIDGSEGFECKHTFNSAEEAMQKIPSLNLDVVLMDINLPEISGIKCVEFLKPKCPNTQFLMFTSFEDTESVFNALKVGANGYITKTTQPAKILNAIVDIHKGGSPMSSHIARKIVNSFQTTKTNSELEKLSSREIEILDLLSKGFRYKEIANQLFLSTETVRTHIRNIYEKLQVNSRTEALNKTYRK
jgi:DNA-binding NarL/FixJ family response regulator